MNEYILTDPISERAVLSSLCKYGFDIWVEVDQILNEDTFTLDSNKLIWKCIRHIFINQDSSIIDLSSLLATAQSLELSYFFNKKTELQYLKSIFNLNIDRQNVNKFILKIRKLQLSRDLRQRLEEVNNKLLEITGEESFNEILNLAEDAICEFSLSLSDQQVHPTKVGENIKEYISFLEENPIEQVGISSGIPEWDYAIGGGLRPATVNLIGARLKVGKSMQSDNITLYIAKNNIKILSLDTEMTYEDRVPRMLAILSGVSINDIESGRFAKNKYQQDKVNNATQNLEKLPFFYKSIAGKPFEEIMAIIRRWIIKEVGLNNSGHAYPCLISYDYIKLMNQSDLSSLQEYQLMGLYATHLHNLAVKYRVPILLFTQLNRDGIESESTAVISSSDRLGWLCSNFTILKNKSEEEIAQEGPEAGNKKLKVIVTRHGPGLEPREHVNLQFKGYCGQIKSLGSNLKSNQDINLSEDERKF